MKTSRKEKLLITAMAAFVGVGTSIILSACSSEVTRFEPRPSKREVRNPPPPQPRTEMKCRSNACLELCAEENEGSPSRPKWCDGFQTPTPKRSVFDAPPD